MRMICYTVTIQLMGIIMSSTRQLLFDANFFFFQLSEEVGYVLYSALGSFYIPSCIMVFVYIRIYYAAKARARRGIKKPPRRPPADAVTSFSTIPAEAKNGGDAAGGSLVDKNSNQSPRDGERQIATIEAPPQPMMIPTVTCDLASDISTSDAGDMQIDPGEQKDTLKVHIYVLFSNGEFGHCPS